MEPSSPSATTTSLITYPSSDPNPSASSSTVPPSSASRQLLKDRLYIGNLHPSVDECVSLQCPQYAISIPTTPLSRYTLLKIFSSFGKVTKLDFLFHKTGVLKGKPRGYAFVEYGSQDVSTLSMPMTFGSLRWWLTTGFFFVSSPPLLHGWIFIIANPNRNRVSNTQISRLRFSFTGLSYLGSS
jgi:hypothetical protein